MPARRIPYPYVHCLPNNAAQSTLQFIPQNCWLMYNDVVIPNLTKNKYTQAAASMHIVLVDEEDNVQGVADKLTSHHADTPLHRGFSVFLFNSKKELLIQQRSGSKKTWPSFWSNSFCGHPQITETYEEAAHRHASFELGIQLQEIHFITDYRYKFSINNIMENEICPIYFAISDKETRINHDEIDNIQLLGWTDFLKFLENNPRIITPWCLEEAYILESSNTFKEFIKE